MALTAFASSCAFDRRTAHRSIHKPVSAAVSAVGRNETTVYQDTAFETLGKRLTCDDMAPHDAAGGN